MATISWLALAAALALAPLPASAGRDRFVVDLVNEPSSLDPHVQWNPDSYYVYRNVFDNLVTRDDKGAIVPQVATSWKNLSDTEVEFTLRDDIVFHDGTKLTPEDVAFSVRRITDKAFASPQRGQFDKITEAVVTGPKTVKLVTDGPYPVLLAQLVKLSIVPKAVVERVGKDAFNQSPVGSGPYRFQGWQRGVAVTLTRNDAYWGEKGPFPTALFRAVPDGATRVADVQTGAADLVVTMDNDQAAQLKSSGKGQALSVLTERVAYMRLNASRPPFDKPAIREAVAAAIDREGLVEGVLGGYDKPSPIMLTPVAFGWVDGIKAPPYDLKRAKAAIAEAGGAGLPEAEFSTSPVFDQRIVQALQQMLAEAGLKVRITVSDMATYLKRSQSGPQGAADMSFGRWSCACQDADGVLFPLLHSSSGWAGLPNADLDRWLDEARSTLDEEKRLAAYRKVHEFVAKDSSWIPLYQSAIIYGASRSLRWQPTPNESMFLNRMSWRD